MLKVQSYLDEQGCHPDFALTHLEAEHGVKSLRVGNLVAVNYGMCETVTDLANECRGLVLEYGTWDVVAFSFKRFFNSHQGHAAEIDWSTAKALEKVDGTLITFYHYDGHWRFSTRGVPDASGEVPAQTGEHFRFYIEGLLYAEGLSVDDLCAGLPEHYCVVCEYVGPYNRIITDYREENLYLLAMTDRDVCEDVEPPETWRWPFSWPVEIRRVGSLEAVMEMTRDLDTLDEGFVVVDAGYNRIKVKAESYRSIARLINAGKERTEKHYAAIVLSGRGDEIKQHFPELAEKIDEHNEALADAIGEATHLWIWNHEIPDRKVFAMLVKHAKLSAWLFMRYGGKTALPCQTWAMENVKPERLAEWTARRVKECLPA